MSDNGKAKVKKRHPHGVLVDECLKVLKKHAGVAFAWKETGGGFYHDGRFFHAGVSGKPDLIGMTTSGVFIGVEVKTGKATLTAKQGETLAKIAKHGGIAAIVRDGCDVVALMEEIEGRV